MTLRQAARPTRDGRGVTALPPVRILEQASKGEAAMSEHEPGDKEHLHESALLHGQEHKGYGEDEGERDESLEPEGHEPEPDAAV
jgi:hypothetical protein